MCKVRIGDRVFDAHKGERLIELLQRYGIEVPHPCAGRGSCGKCRAFADGQEILTCKYVIEGDVTVLIPDRGGVFVDRFELPEGEDTEGLFYALDVGTTTLCLSLVTGDGREVCRVSALNPQAVFGADVITRIEQCTRGGVESLRVPIVRRINEMIAAAGGGACRLLALAGNATMLHILAGEDCSSIGRAPYTPVFLEGREYGAGELGIFGCEKVRFLPSAHSFVGADVVAGLTLIDAPGVGRYKLFCDLGTNAEIALVGNEGILCTAAAAGPCFEGSNIDCGMSALEGAICSVDIDGGEVKYETVGGGAARGICATGLIDGISTLLECEMIDETGYMEEDFYFSEGVRLTPGDVRNFQLAKSAVCSAMEALMALSGIGAEKVDALYLSGGFAKKLSVKRAASVGLIPASLAEKCVVIEDSCICGIIRAVTGKSDPDMIAKSAKYCDLSTDSVFCEKFIENISFES